MVTVRRGFYESDFERVNQGQCGCGTWASTKIYLKGFKPQCSTTCLKRFAIQSLPFLRMFQGYRIKRDLLADVLAGVTNAVMHIPQGIAFALLSSVPPVIGLYVSFFAPLMYFFLGTSRHISIGTTAITSLMVGSFVTKQMALQFPEQENSTLIQTNTEWPLTISESLGAESVSSTTMPHTQFGTKEAFQVSVAVSLTFLVGLIQFGMGVVRLGFITTYLSAAMLNGFTTGAAFHVFTSQVKHIFDIKVGRYSGPFKLVYTYMDVFTNLKYTNVATFITSVVCIIVLVLFKECINNRFRERLRVPIPIELIVVIAGTCVSYFAKLNSLYGVATIGKLPSGLPPPSVPNLSQAVAYLPDAFVIAIVCYAVHIAMASIFARKHDYQIDSNQELLANGGMNIATSFFSCFVAGTSMSRSLVQEMAGGVTQLCALISSAVLLIVLLVLGYLLTDLPRCVLAAIIVVALKGMFKQFAELHRLWFFSKIDAIVWFITWLGTMLLDIDLGLLVGVTASILSLVFRAQWPRAAMLGQLEDDIYRDEKRCSYVRHINGIVIYHYEAPLCFINAEHFQNHLYSTTCCNPILMKQKLKTDKKLLKKETTKITIDDINKDADSKGQFNNGFVHTRLSDDGGEINSLDSPEKNQWNLTELPKTAAISASDEFNGEYITSIDVHPSDSCTRTRDDAKGTYHQNTDVHHIIIDCSSVSFIDSAGVSALHRVFCEYKEVGIAVFLSNCGDSLRTVMVNEGFFDKHNPLSLFYSVNDAIKAAISE